MIEGTARTRSKVVVWRHVGETSERAIRRHVIENPHTDGAEFLVIGWALPTEETAA